LLKEKKFAYGYPSISVFFFGNKKKEKQKKGGTIYEGNMVTRGFRSFRAPLSAFSSSCKASLYKPGAYRGCARVIA
jgi:hypothetical protein